MALWERSSQGFLRPLEIACPSPGTSYFCKSSFTSFSCQCSNNSPVALLQARGNLEFFFWPLLTLPWHSVLEQAVCLWRKGKSTFIQYSAASQNILWTTKTEQKLNTPEIHWILNKKKFGFFVLPAPTRTNVGFFFLGEQINSTTCKEAVWIKFRWECHWPGV